MEEKITVVIPTYERPECIKFFLENLKKTYDPMFRFEVHDSSNSIDTFKIIDEFNKNNPIKILYKKYSSSLSADEKMYKIMKEVEGEYIQLSTDCYYLDYKKISSSFIDNNFEKYDYIKLESSFNHRLKCSKKMFKRDINIIKNDFEKDEYIKEFLVGSTMWGSTIVKNSVIKNAIKEGYFQKYIEANAPCWMFSFSILEYMFFNCNKEKFAYYCTDLWKENEAKYLYPHWQKAEKWYDISFYQFNTAVSLLTNKLEHIKKNIVKNLHKALVSMKTLYILRQNNTINKPLLKKYKKYIVKFDNIYLKMVIVSLVPISLLKFLRNLKHFFKK